MPLIVISVKILSSTSNTTSHIDTHAIKKHFKSISFSLAKDNAYTDVRNMSTCALSKFPQLNCTWGLWVSKRFVKVTFRIQTQAARIPSWTSTQPVTLRSCIKSLCLFQTLARFWSHKKSLQHLFFCSDLEPQQFGFKELDFKVSFSFWNKKPVVRHIDERNPPSVDR